MGRLHKTTGSYIGAWDCPTEFTEWRLHLEDGFIRATFRRKIKSSFRSAKWTTPFDPTIKKDITFTNEADWKVFDEEFAKLIERQKKLYPEQHKEQKSNTIKDINFKTKHWPKMMAEEKVVKHLEYILSIVRKRK